MIQTKTYRQKVNKIITWDKSEAVTHLNKVVIQRTILSEIKMNQSIQMTISSLNVKANSNPQ